MTENVSETNGESESSNGNSVEAAEESQATTDEGAPGPTTEEEPPEDPLTAAIEEAKRLKDQWLRTAADFDNFRKRSRREVSDAAERGKEDLLKELLPVFDNLERAAEHAKSATEVTALADGIDLVIKQFIDTLSKIGVEKLDAVGQAFDPSVHEAIQHLETNEVPPGSVAHQVQAGYKLNGRLIRPCMVVVAKAQSTE